MELAAQVTGPYDHVLAIAKIAEGNGFAAVALADHYLNGSSDEDYGRPMYDSLVQAAALARDTDRVELAMVVSPVTFRHPAVYAKAMTSIDELSGGRFALGIGTGWHDDEHLRFGIPYPPLAERFEMLEDALAYVHGYMTEPEAGYAGKRFAFDGFAIAPKHRPSARLIVGGTGAVKTPRLAGRFAGEFNIPSLDPDVVAARVHSMKAAAVEAGRDPDGIRISTAYRMIAGDSTSEIDEFLAEWGSLRGQTVAEMRSHIGDRIPMLSWDDHLDRLAGLEAQGFDRCYIKVIVKSERAFSHAAKKLADFSPSMPVPGSASDISSVT